MHSFVAVADPPLRTQVHPDKCSHPHATSAFEVLGHANQQLQSEEVMHELRHVLTLARGAPPSPRAPSWLLCFASRQPDTFASPERGGRLHSACCTPDLQRDDMLPAWAMWQCRLGGAVRGCARVVQSPHGTMGRGLPGSAQVRGARF